MARPKRGDDPIRTLRRLIVAGAFATLRTLVLAVPQTWDRWIGRRLIGIVRILAPTLTSRMYDHLRMVYGGEMSARERRDLAERTFDHYARGVIEFVRMSQLRPEDVRRRTRVRGKRNLHRALDQDAGVILITAHYGNFEMMAANCGAYGLPIVVIARSRADELVEQYINQTRSKHSVNVVYKLGWRAALEVLREGGTVGVLADQAVRTGGAMADFLGHASPTAVGPVLLAQRTGALMVPAFITRDANDRFTVDLHAALDLPRTDDEAADMQTAVEIINDVIGRQIRHKPEEWLWLHRRWKQAVSVRSGRVRLEHALGPRAMPPTAQPASSE